jgi:hypothetical protein
MRCLYAVTALDSLLLLALDAWPGAIGFALLCPFFCCATAPLLWAAGVVWVIVVARVAGGEHRFGRRVKVCIGWMAICVCLVLLEVPRTVAFWCHRDRFEDLAATAPVEYGGTPVGRWVGIYYVIEYAADDRGGVYFVTIRHPDGIGPDAVSYGFSLRPSRKSCPFGMSAYTESWLFGNWYSFSVSDD